MNIINGFMNESEMIKGASYIGKPIDNTIMFVTKKVQKLMLNLEGHNGCIVFAEEGIDLSAISKTARDNNHIIMSNNPQLEYIKMAEKIEKQRILMDKKRNYRLMDNGYYVGENVILGEDCYIEPGCLIGHDVRLGDNCRILKGAVIKNTTIGNNVLINEYAVIGSNGFTMGRDEKGNMVRIPTLGNVVIGNGVEIGAHDNVSCGSAGNTVIEDYAKIDSLVHIGHDVIIHKNAEITAGTILGGFDEIGEGVFIGLNTSIRNRTSIGNKCTIDMGSVVVRNIEEETTVFGNPARKIVKPNTDNATGR